MSSSYVAASVGQAPHRTAIIVVHGVGDTKPGETLDYVVDEVAARAPGLVPTSYSRTRLVAEPEGLLVRGSAQFPVHERDIRLGDGTEATAFELYWADLTRLRGSGLSAALGMLRTLFETPHVVDALLRHRPDLLSRMLRPLLLFATNFLRGPLAGFCATLFAGGLIFLSYYYIPNRGPVNGMVKALGGPAELIPYFLTYKVYFTAMLLAFGGCGLWLFAASRERDVGWADLGLFSGLCAIIIVVELHVRSAFAPELQSMLPPVIAAGLGQAEPINWTHSGPAHLAAFKLYYPRLTWLWMIWAGVVALAIAIYALMFVIDRLQGRVHGPRGAGAGIAITVLQATAWLSTIPVLGVLMIDSVRNVFTSEFDRQMFQAVVQAVNAVSTVPASALEQWLNDYKASARGLDPMIGTALRELTLSFLWNGGLLVMLALTTAVFAVARFYLVKRVTAPVGAAHEHWHMVSTTLPRLIVNNTLIVLLIVLGVVQAALIITYNLEERPPAPEIFIPLGLAVAGVLLVVVRVIRPYIDTALGGILHIAQDLIDHHYRTRAGFSGHVRLRGRLSGADVFPRRQRIANRLDALVKTLIANKGFDDVLFLAHSQGTVIVFDYLCSVRERGGVLGQYRPFVLTAGSPLGHLYQHYFDDYRSLDAQLEALRPTVQRWVNVYRCDDPIGGAIGPASGSGSGTDEGAFPQNLAMHPGGHLAYWAEPEVAKTIAAMLEEAGRSPPLERDRQSTS